MRNRYENVVAGLLSLLLSSCSWLSEGQYHTCEVTYQCERCEDLEVRVFCENARSSDSKEVENPVQ